MARNKKKHVSYIGGVNSRIKSFYTSLRRGSTTKKIINFIDKRPLLSFFVLLGALFALIATGNIISRLSTKPQKEELFVKPVSIYSIGSAPKVSVTGEVKKTGVVKVIAQTSGIVQSINVLPGSSVAKGTSIVSLASNYNGENAPAIQAQITYNQYKLAKETFDTQRQVIEDQKKLASDSHQNTENLRLISQRSLGDTQELLRLNEELLNGLNSTLGMFEASNSAGINDQMITTLQGQKSQLLASVVQIRSQLRSLEYQATSDAPPANMAELQKSITLAQLDIQRKTLEVNLEIARLQSALSMVNASFMNPSSPFDATVEKVDVEVGQLVNPGTIIATVSSPNQIIEVVALVPGHIAQNVSILEPSVIHINNNTLSVYPRYISSEATDGQLYSIVFDVDVNLSEHTTDDSVVAVEVPIGAANTTANVPYIPIDSVFQTQDKSYVFIADQNLAKSQEVKLGNVYGRYVEVLKGVGNNTKIILNRNVIAGDKVSVSQ